MMFRMEEDKPAIMWVEKTKESVLLGDAKSEQEKYDEILEEIKSKKSEKKKKKSPENFSRVEKYSFETLAIPKGLDLKLVEISGIDESLEEEGLIAFHYFPQGLVEETSMQLSLIHI